MKEIMNNSIRKYPQIYSYTKVGDSNCIQKIGYTEHYDVCERINEQTTTANVDYGLNWYKPAFYNHNKIENFKDSDFHNFLKEKGIERIRNKQTNRLTEFFKFENPEQSKELFEEFISINPKNGIKIQKKILYTLRPSQEEAINQTLETFKESNKMLWNAKPRFGKTLTSYDLAKRLEAKTVLVVTNRPSISDSWYSDYVKFVEDYAFVENFENKKNTKEHSMSIEDFGKQKEFSKKIIFLSLQDLKGSKYFGEENIDKLEWLTKEDIDLLIIDESHEGVDTNKTTIALDNLNTNKILYLSGTPFKALANGKFSSNEIFNYTYEDEQNDKDSDNPQLALFTYTMSNNVKNEVDKGLDIEGNTFNYSFDFGEFLKANSKNEFLRKDDVKSFIKSLYTNGNHPFKKFKDKLEHTFWLVGNRVNSVKALGKLLKNDEFFKDYEIIVVAGKPDEKEEDSKKSIEKVKKKIKNCKEKNKKTITLSCGQLTTGVTVNEWSAVLMLNSSSSPERYVQTMFRCQNPYFETHDGKQFKRTKSYVFDFSPYRCLEIVESFSLGLTESSSFTDFEKKEKIKNLLNFLPVHIIDSETAEFEPASVDMVFHIPRDEFDKNLMEGKSSSGTINLENVNSNKDNDNRLKEYISRLNENIKNGKSRINKNPNYSIEVNGCGKNLGSKIREEHLKDDNLGHYNDVEKCEEKVSKSKEIKTSEIQEDKNQEIEKVDSKKETKQEKDDLEVLKKLHLKIPLLIQCNSFDDDLTLEKLFDKTDDEIFEEIMFTTKDIFKHVFDNYLNKDVWNRLFNRWKAIRYEKDFFENVEPLKENQIFTPVNIIEDMVNKIDEKLFQKTDSAFIDIYMKSGLYISMIVQRLFDGTRDKYKSNEDCYKHIFKNQVFGLSPNKTLHNISKNYIFKGRDYKEHNLIVCDLVQEFKNKKENKDEFIINLFKKKRNLRMIEKFDVIIGNPPYQGDYKYQIYPQFYKVAQEIGNEVVMIFPAGWQQPKKANGLGIMNNEETKQDRQIVSIDNREEVFGNLGTGTINIIHWRSGYDNGLKGKQKVYTEGENPESTKLLINPEDVKKHEILVQMGEIISKSKSFESFEKEVSSRNVYNLATDFFEDQEKYGYKKIDSSIRTGDVKIRGRKNQTLYVDNNYFDSSFKYNGEKILIQRFWGGGYYNCSYADIIIGDKNEICTDSYVMIKSKNRQESEYKSKYIMTRFFRALLYLNKNSYNVSKEKFKSIPLQDYSEPWWDESIEELEQRLFDKYNIPEDIRNFVLENIQKKTEENIMNFDKFREFEND